MCSPTLIVMGVGLALSAAQARAQQQAAKASARAGGKSAQAQEDQRQENAVRANINFEDQIKRTRRKMSELKSSSSQDAFDARTEYLKARGSAVAAAASAGVEGVSIRDLMVDFAATTGRNDSTRSTNLQRKLDAIHDDERDLHAQTLARRDGIPPPADVAGASSLPGAITAARGAATAVQGYQASKPKTFTPTSTSAGLTISGSDTNGWYE